MVFGLLIALGVALFVSKSQLPFSGAETQGAVPNVSPGPGNSPPDPNSAIYGKANVNQGNVVTIDPFQQGTEPQAGDATQTDQIEPVAQTIYFLQLGSFRNREDAEQLRAQLAFVGTESEIAVGEVNGNVVNRVLRREVPRSTPGKIDVVEFFWYGCIHCYNFEPKVNAWYKKLPSDVVFTKIPIAYQSQRVNFQGHQRLYYTLEAMGKLDMAHSKVFEAMHKDKKQLANDEQIFDFAESIGLKREEFAN
eukprot:gene13439-13215_t